jgi:hypothetical protein
MIAAAVEAENTVTWVFCSAYRFSCSIIRDGPRTGALQYIIILLTMKLDRQCPGSHDH